jgi:hypothetical protein
MHFGAAAGFRLWSAARPDQLRMSPTVANSDRMVHPWRSPLRSAFAHPVLERATRDFAFWVMTGTCRIRHVRESASVQHSPASALGADSLPAQLPTGTFGRRGAFSLHDPVRSSCSYCPGVMGDDGVRCH